MGVDGIFMWSVLLAPIILLGFSDAFVAKTVRSGERFSSSKIFQRTSPSLAMVDKAPYDDIIPFLSEHIQLSDMLMVVGASTDIALQLSKEGYGTKITGFIHVVDSNKENIETLQELAMADPILAANVADNRLRFTAVNDLTKMPEVCKQR
jgi:hypothetical protein